jgi:hypothetical protein
MAFTVRDYQDLLNLLSRHPEWREELRRAILSEDFLALPQIVRELAAAQKRTEEQVRELAAAQKRTEEQVRELAAAQKRTEERLEELAAAQKRTEEQVRELAAAQKNMGAELGRLSSLLGVSLEDEAGSVLETVMRQKGYRALQEAGTLRFDGDVDVALQVEDRHGRRLWALLESKARLSRRDVEKWAQRVRSAEWRQFLKEAGCNAPYLVYMYAMRVDVSAREAVQESGIGLLKAEGEVIAPAGEMD